MRAWPRPVLGAYALMTHAVMAAASCLFMSMAAASDDRVLPSSTGEPGGIPSGYVFDQPELLADQVLWGVAHGVRLLGQACARKGEGAAAEAWITWQEREAKAIAAYHLALSRHYFQRDDISPLAIAAALGLKPELDILPERLLPACDTLAEALKQPRYDLERQRVELLKENDKPR